MASYGARAGAVVAAVDGGAHLADVSAVAGRRGVGGVDALTGGGSAKITVGEGGDMYTSANVATMAPPGSHVVQKEDDSVISYSKVSDADSSVTGAATEIATVSQAPSCSHFVQKEDNSVISFSKVSDADSSVVGAATENATVSQVPVPPGLHASGPTKSLSTVKEHEVVHEEEQSFLSYSKVFDEAECSNMGGCINETIGCKALARGGAGMRIKEDIVLLPRQVQLPGPVAPLRWLGAANLNRGKPADRPPTPDEEDEILRQKLRVTRRVHDWELLPWNEVPDSLTRNRPGGFVTKIHNLYEKYHDSSVIRRQMLHLLLKGRRMTKEFFLLSKQLGQLRDDIYALIEEIKSSWSKFKIKAPSYMMVDPDLLPPHR